MREEGKTASEEMKRVRNEVGQDAGKKYTSR